MIFSNDPLLNRLHNNEVGSDVEVMGKRPDQDFVQRVKEIYNQEMEPIEKANPGQRAYIIPDRPIEEYFMIRKRM